MEQTFTIKEAAQHCGLSTHTLRYYEKEGLLLDIQRNESGVRLFHQSDLDHLELIICLRNSGMPIKQIKNFVQLGTIEHSNEKELLSILENHKQLIQLQQKQLQVYLETIDCNIDYYTTLLNKKND